MRTLLLLLMALCLETTALASDDHAAWNAKSPSYSCAAKHLAAVETSICKEEPLWNIDRALTALFQGVLRSSDSQHQKMVSIEQRRWLATRDRCSDLDCIDEAYSRRSRQLWERIVADSEGKPVPLMGTTPVDRIAYLRFVSDYYQLNNELGDEYFAPGLRDEDADVRSFTAFKLSGPRYTGMLIDLLVTEPDVDVRQSIAFSVNCELTCNGTEPCAESSTVEGHLDNLIAAYNRATADHRYEAARALGQVFTAYAGEENWNRCLSPKAREKARRAISQE